MMRQGRGTEVLNPILCHGPRMRQVRVAMCRLCRFMTRCLAPRLTAPPFSMLENRLLFRFQRPIEGGKPPEKRETMCVCSARTAFWGEDYGLSD